MRIDFEQVIRDLKEQPLKNGEDGPLTLGGVTCTTMIGVLPEDQNIAPEEKVKMFRLAQLATKGGEQEVKTEDLAMLKKRVGKMFGALVVGRVFDLIEGEPNVGFVGKD
jgi:hypothetical protein